MEIPLTPALDIEASLVVCLVDKVTSTSTRTFLIYLYSAELDTSTRGKIRINGTWFDLQLSNEKSI